MSERLVSKLPIEHGSILGVNYNGGHDSSVSVVAPDGRITFACSLERVTRRKQDGRFPRALLDLIDFDRISACALPAYHQGNTAAGPSGQRFHSLRHSIDGYPVLPFPEVFYSLLDTIPVSKVFVGHELSHAASAYYLSQFEDAVVLTYDAGMYNEPWFGGVFHARGRNLDAVEYFPSQTNAKVASLYAIVTGLLGYKPLRHEGKLTGLAAYATPDQSCLDLLHSLLTERYAEMEGTVRWINAFDVENPPQFVVDSEARRRLLTSFGEASPATIAASLQHVTERHVLGIVQRIKEQDLSERLCLAGGLFANVRLNQRIHDAWGGPVFVAPPMGDDGAGLGAALFAAFQNESSLFPVAKTSMFLGHAYSADEAHAVLERYEIQTEKLERPANTLARLLAEGSTVGIFTGPMEFGPRALGHRSVLAPATDPTINQTLNQKLRRTEFMPFAPITRIEDASRCYCQLDGAEHSAEYMTLTFDATPELAAACPAIVHVDGTVRPQLVREETNPLLHTILTEYQGLTGVSSLINTSFNIHEEPIVCSPEDALRGFVQARLDYLYMEGFLIPLASNMHLLASDLSERSAADSRSDEVVVSDYLWREMGELHRAARERLELVEQLHGKAEEYRGAIGELEAQLENQRRTYGDVAILSVVQRVELLVQEVVKRQLDTEQLEQARQLMQARIVALESANAAAEAAAAARLAAAEDTAAARLAVIEEQKRALQHLQFWSFSTRVHQFLEPRIGVLYQYPPRRIDIPDWYLEGAEVMSAPSISVVTPSYNQGAFIERTLRSALDQDYPALEYIVQDAGSKDDTPRVLEQLAPRLSHVASEPDGGFANGLNIGFSKSTGEIMAYLNSDDRLLPGSLNYIAHYFTNHPEVDVVYGHRVVIDEYDGEIGRWVLPPHDDVVLSWADYVPQETLFWRRRIWDRIGGRVDESFSFAVDWDLLIRFREAGAHMVRLPRFLGAFRVHPHQKTSAEMEEVGTREMARIRERCLGRVVDYTEISRSLRPYLRKHVVYNKLYRLGVLRY
jgi:carbamoyltransferase